MRRRVTRRLTKLHTMRNVLKYRKTFQNVRCSCGSVIFSIYLVSVLYINIFLFLTKILFYDVIINTYEDKPVHGFLMNVDLCIIRADHPIYLNPYDLTSDSASHPGPCYLQKLSDYRWVTLSRTFDFLRVL